MRIIRDDRLGIFFMTLDVGDFDWKTGEGDKAFTLTVGDISVSGADPLNVRQQVQRSLQAGGTPETVVLQRVAAENPWVRHAELRVRHLPLEIEDQLTQVTIVSAIGFTKDYDRWAIVDQYGYRGEGRGRNFLSTLQQMEHSRCTTFKSSAENTSLNALIENPEQVCVRAIKRIDNLDEVPPIRILMILEQSDEEADKQTETFQLPITGKRNALSKLFRRLRSLLHI